jgi:enterochelin esterase-like enzyme
MSSFRTLRSSEPRHERDGLRFITVKSRALGRRADLTVFVPPGIEGPLPLAILLHGVYGSHWHWAFRGGVHRTAQALIEACIIAPLAIAMPSDGLWGDGSGYLPHPGGDAERWIVDEVPAAVAEMPGFEPAGPLLLGGLSMGGFGALRLGAAYGSRFAAVSAHSPITHLEQLAMFVEEPLDAYGVAGTDLSVFETILRHRDTLPPLRFDCGAEDPLLPHSRALHEALHAAGIPHTYEEFPGRHEWTYWEIHVARSLRFFDGALRAATARHQ